MKKIEVIIASIILIPFSFSWIQVLINKQRIYGRMGITAFFFVGCLTCCTANKTGTVEYYNRIFSEKYNVQADTCIQLDNNTILFTKDSLQAYPNKKNIYIFRQEHSQWNEILKTELDYFRLGNPINFSSIEIIGGKEYFYLEYNTGASKRGDNIDFFLYELDMPNNEYYLKFYCYCVFR